MTIIRALTLALWCAFASALSPLAVAGDDGDCALYLTGPGRSSAYDYSINLLKGNFGYEGQHTCITYDAINQAYLEGRNRILVSQPKGDWKPEDYASVGELVLDISINLARRYGLTYEEIEKGLPLIDTSRTLIREVCPPVFSHVECRAGKYRRLDGLCNNLQHPTWGSTNTPFQRLIGPLFSDGINAPRISHTGRDLPLSRVVSRTMHPDDGFHDHAGTVMVIAWGQFMDHDYTLTGTPLDPLNRNDPEECCKRPPHLKHPYCNEIRIPDDDYFYRLFNVKCIDFVRAFPSPRPGCRLGSRIAYNTLTGVIDGNTVYGVTEKFSRKLRTGYGGLLRMNPVFKEYGLKDLLPLKLDIPDEGCTRPNKNMYCFEAGEIRVNEQLILTVMHTLMAREHNRVAQALAEVNPHWDDETLFQEARRINIAEIQHITYNEFLPILLGKDVMEKFGLVLEKEGYWDGYDREVNPDVIASFAAAAYRFGHSLLPTAVERWSKAHKFIASKRLSDLIRRPYDLYRAGVIDEYVMGLMNQVAQAMDDSITQEVTNHLFKKVGARFGMDLVSFNMQRGREFGLPGYMEFRKFCGLSGADSFQDLFGTMSNHTVRKYETIFEHPIDVDLWSGGVSERPLPGSMLGPTFACIIATQFSYSRRGDRFWFELPNQPSSFTREQLAEIRKSRLARIICDNTDIIDTVQLYPMVLPDHELNPRVPCRSGILPGMDFSKWAETTPFPGHAKQFITHAHIPANNESEQHKEHIDTENINNIFNLTDSMCGDLNTTADKNTDRGCNHSTVQDVLLQKDNYDTKHVTVINTENSKKQKDCGYEMETNTDKCQNQTKNEIPNNDTILKYVYKKTENANTPQKSKSHIKNILKRRKRSIRRQKNNRFANNSKHKAPIIIESSHPPTNIEITVPVTDKNIKASALADFNIETLHDNVPTDKSNSFSGDNNKKHSKENLKPHLHNNDGKYYEKSTEESQESSDESGQSSKEVESSESVRDKDEYRDSKRMSDTIDANSSESLYSSEENNELKNENHSHKENSEESKESNERDGYTEKKPRSSKTHGESLESLEKDISYENVKPAYKSKQRNSSDSKNNEHLTHLPDSVENNSESIEDQIQVKPHDDDYKNESRLHRNKNSKEPIQEVDLDDFSYEKIQVNEKGEVEVAKDSQENSDSTVPILDSSTAKPDIMLGKYDEINSLLSKEDSSSNIERSNENYEPVNINDGEIKPVVEINSENNSDESSEKNTKEPLKSDLNIKDKSLETLSDDKATDKSEQNDDRVTQKEDQKDGNVKQEFERIPLNYKHDDDDKGQKQYNEKKNPNDENTKDDGTLDTLIPKEENYDEHLNIKFDDLTIKLPDIKLPDDILSYAYDKPEYESESERNKGPSKQKFYQHNNGDSEEHQDKDNDDDELGQDYYGYYGDGQEKQDYKKVKTQEASDEDNDDDLYEKFVRERFGKRGSFQKRSERLQDVRSKPENSQLYEALKGILKKTEEVQKEAEKSGDPKAGYLWTLEYGENA